MDKDTDEADYRHEMCQMKAELAALRTTLDRHKTAILEIVDALASLSADNTTNNIPKRAGNDILPSSPPVWDSTPMPPFQKFAKKHLSDLQQSSKRHAGQSTSLAQLQQQLNQCKKMNQQGKLMSSSYSQSKTRKS